jgi:hypothetical protein
MQLVRAVEDVCTLSEELNGQYLAFKFLFKKKPSRFYNLYTREEVGAS